MAEHCQADHEVQDHQGHRGQEVEAQRRERAGEVTVAGGGQVKSGTVKAFALQRRNQLLKRKRKIMYLELLMIELLMLPNVEQATKMGINQKRPENILEK